jgi:hypothetical protein
MDVPKTMSPLTIHRAVQHRAMSAALAAVTARRCALAAHALDMPWVFSSWYRLPKATSLGHVTGPRPSRTLWHWAPAWPG